MLFNFEETSIYVATSNTTSVLSTRLPDTWRANLVTVDAHLKDLAYLDS